MSGAGNGKDNTVKKPEYIFECGKGIYDYVTFVDCDIESAWEYWISRYIGDPEILAQPLPLRDGGVEAWKRDTREELEKAPEQRVKRILTETSAPGWCAFVRPAVVGEPTPRYDRYHLCGPSPGIHLTPWARYITAQYIREEDTRKSRSIMINYTDFRREVFFQSGMIGDQRANEVQRGVDNFPGSLWVDKPRRRVPSWINWDHDMSFEGRGFAQLKIEQIRLMLGRQGIDCRDEELFCGRFRQVGGWDFKKSLNEVVE